MNGKKTTLIEEWKRISDYRQNTQKSETLTIANTFKPINLELDSESASHPSWGQGQKTDRRGTDGFFVVVYLPTLHIPIKKTKTSLLNLLNHKEQKFPNRKKVSADAKFQQMPQTSISTFSDMRVNLLHQATCPIWRENISWYEVLCLLREMLKYILRSQGPLQFCQIARIRYKTG